MTQELPKELEEEIPSIEDFKGVVERLRRELESARSDEMADAGDAAKLTDIANIKQAGMRKETG